MGHREKPKEQIYRPKSKNSETPPVASEKPKVNIGEITHLSKAQEQVTQQEKDSTTGSRTHNEENQEKNDATSGRSTNGTVNTQQPPNKQKSQE